MRLNSREAQDRQLAAINSAEADFKATGDLDALIYFWEDVWMKGGLMFNGVTWTFRLVELYYKAGRYDDAWQLLDVFVLTKPDYIENTRKWQIKILKKEKKDTAHIQHQLDNGQ